MRQRRRNLLKHARKTGCDALAAFEPENLFYMTGFWGEAVGLLKKGRTVIITPELEAGRAAAESTDCDVIVAQRGSGMIPTLAREAGRSSVCTDCRDYTTMTAVKKLIPRVRQSVEPFYESRMIKDEAEARILKKASRIIDGMFEMCAKKMRAGQKESELQAILMNHAMEHGMFDTGYHSTLNPLIIAGGPNGALPHAQVTGRKFKRGDLVVVDLTLRYKGYVSDATRTFAVGAVPAQASDAYGIVKESQKLGLGAVCPGKLCSDVDSACRNYIEKNGHGKYFIHSTGHGIGLEVHEPPAVSTGSHTKLRKNMAITVEPGVYMDGKFGIRIEDSVLVRDRPVVMHKFTKDMITV
ncbi:MAG: M24 family metallopeptidase [Nitrosopumilus sp. B06]|nr:MAG: M24 family metallopeptidase [Nitrosopumilus sp. B06]